MTTFQFYPNRPPSLDDVLYPNQHDPPHSPYDRDSFTRFLCSFHCLENLEFVMEIDRLITCRLKVDSETSLDENVIHEHSRLAASWAIIYRMYLHSDGERELNVPKKASAKFSPDIVPSTHDLHEIRELAYELLMVNYRDFVSYTREKEGKNSIQRRPSETVAPDTLCSPGFSGMANDNVGFIWPVSPVLNPRSSDEDDSHALSSARSHSAGTIFTRTSSRGSSMGSIIDSFKEHSGIKKTMQIFRTRRASHEKPENFIH